MEFGVKNVEVITRRNRVQEPCEKDWKNYDKYIMNEMLRKAGCRPPHWKTDLDLSICSDPQQMKIFSRQPNTAELESFIQPCKIINKLDYTYEEYDIGGELENG